MGTAPLQFITDPPKPFRIDPQWRCQRSGECCEQIPQIVMTQEEATVLRLHAPPEIALTFTPHSERAGVTFVSLKAGPCPLFAFTRCHVYEVRPYNCRRFGCMRPDTAAEPFLPSGENMSARVAVSKAARKLAKYMQRRAQPWADAHGWKPEV